MRRKILFRGKQFYKRGWVEGNLLYDEKNKQAYIAENFLEQYANTCQVIPETVGQYAGSDKNGKKIFEGDIVKTKTGRLCIVYWFVSPSFCGFDLKPVDTVENILHTSKPPAHDLFLPENLEVIGNIYESN